MESKEQGRNPSGSSRLEEGGGGNVESQQVVEPSAMEEEEKIKEEEAREGNEDHHHHHQQQDPSEEPVQVGDGDMVDDSKVNKEEKERGEEEKEEEEERPTRSRSESIANSVGGPSSVSIRRSRSPSRSRSRSRSLSRSVSRSPSRSDSRSRSRGRSYNNSQASRTPSPRRGSISRSLSRSLSRSRSRSRSLVSSRSGSSSGHHGRYDSDSRSDTHPQVSKVRGNRRSSRKGEGEGEEELHTVMVKGLTKNVEEYHLEEIFGFYGRIQSVHLPIYRRSGENKSYAQIVYSKPSMAQKAVEHMDKGQIDGSLLTVSLCEEPDLRDPTPPPPDPRQQRYGGGRWQAPDSRRGSQRRRSRSPLEIERHPYARQPFSKREEVVERSDEWRRGDFGKGGYERGTSQRWSSSSSRNRRGWDHDEDRRQGFRGGGGQRQRGHDLDDPRGSERREREEHRWGPSKDLESDPIPSKRRDDPPHMARSPPLNRSRSRSKSFSRY